MLFQECVMAVSDWLDLLLLLLVVAAAAQDLATRRIANRLLLAGGLGALGLHMCSAAPALALGAGLGGALTGLVVFLPLYCLRGMAAGDVKLLAAVGAFGTPGDVLEIAAWSMCAGGVMALVVVIATGRLRAAAANVMCLVRPLLMRLVGLPAATEPLRSASVGAIPYGLAIACGTMYVVAQRYH
jgi:prepilin peptidase CpaA